VLAWMNEQRETDDATGTVLAFANSAAA